MSLVTLYPAIASHASLAIEERYASWQTRLLLGEVTLYDPAAPLRVAADHALVVTDPMLLPPPGLARRLIAALEETPGAVAAVPAGNEAERAEQRRDSPAPYLLLSELQAATAELERQPREVRRVVWDRSDPGLYLCRGAFADGRRARDALDGATVAVSMTDYVHRYASMRGGLRGDLLERIGAGARAVLELGCGEGALGAALKQRQPCRVVGIELDAAAAAVAATRIDRVLQGDARAVIRELDERFDWIVGGDVVEHVDDPWTLLAELRRVALPGARLLLTLPNVANGSVIAALLDGRFDYTYMGLLCAGHLRFFTRRSIQEMLAIAGWSAVELTPQEGPLTPAARALRAALGTRWSAAEHEPVGFYVLARHGG